MLFWVLFEANLLPFISCNMIISACTTSHVSLTNSVEILARSNFQQLQRDNCDMTPRHPPPEELFKSLLSKFLVKSKIPMKAYFAAIADGRIALVLSDQEELFDDQIFTIFKPNLKPGALFVTLTGEVSSTL